MKKFTERKVYQIVDKNSKYRSFITFKGEPIEYISEERNKALIYTYDEAKKVAKYYIEEKNIPVMIECRIVKKRSEI